MNKVYKYGFVIAIIFIIGSQFFGSNNTQELEKLEQKINTQNGFIDSLLLTNHHHQRLVLELQEAMLLREDSLFDLKNREDSLIIDYEKKIYANRYRTVAEFEGYLTNRYPNRQRSDYTQVESGANN